MVPLEAARMVAESKQGVSPVNAVTEAFPA